MPTNAARLSKDVKQCRDGEHGDLYRIHADLIVGDSRQWCRRRELVRFTSDKLK